MDAFRPQKNLYSLSIPLLIDNKPSFTQIDLSYASYSKLQAIQNWRHLYIKNEKQTLQSLESNSSIFAYDDIPDDKKCD